MPSFIFCCTCAAARGRGSSFIDDKTEKPRCDVHLSCCGRTICARCIDSNPRLATYCPFCQRLRLEQAPSSSQANPPLPPPYTVDDPESLETIPSRTPPPPPQPSFAELAQPNHPPPSYAAVPPPPPLPSTLQSTPSGHHPLAAPVSGERQTPSGDSIDEDVTHFLHPTDTLPSLSLAYSVPIQVLRSHNHLHSDHLLSARRTIKVPRSYYQGASRSPRPVEGEEESERKAKLRRFMVRCKCADYRFATLYLEECEWDLEKAVEKWWDDERWEREHPMPKGRVMGKR